MLALRQMSDLTDVFTRMPALLGLGLSLQFTVMPLLGFALSRCGMLDHWDAFLLDGTSSTIDHWQQLFKPSVVLAEQCTLQIP